MSSIKIYKLTKSVILVKSIIYEVYKVSSIVIRGTSTFFFFKNHKTHKNTHKLTKIHFKNKAITIFLVTFVYFHLLLVT